MPMSKGEKWVLWGVIGCGCALFGVAVLGIVAAIVIPNFVDATQKAKQKRTVAELREVSTALAGYQSDHGSYPSAATDAELRAAIAGNGYTGQLVDGWGKPLRYTCLGPAEDGCSSYELASGGKDGHFEQEPGLYADGEIGVRDFDADLVIRDGELVRRPAVVAR